MMISTKGTYALRVMIDLAQHANEGYISLKSIAERQKISMKYLETIVSLLNKGGLVLSLRGKDGGYMLKRPAEEYCIGEILRLTEGGLTPVSCHGFSEGERECENVDRCLTFPMWQKLDTLINEYLDKVSLRDLLDGNV
ncbi:MAG: Rrf2 family transcriptional regulator [Ruminococcus sp.]|nr:Rrf2 family transcriptional regulator [Ruminococcus sp.]